MGPLGWQETVFIFLLALLIFGPKKLPELGKTVGKALTEFRRASSDLKANFEREMNAIERETQLKEVTQSLNNQIQTYDDSSYYYDGGYGSESYDSTASDTSLVSASATQGAEQTAETSGDTVTQTAPDSTQPETVEAGRTPAAGSTEKA
jgi:Tat protein translocase TatB subunit